MNNVGRVGTISIHVTHLGILKTQLSNFDGIWIKVESVA